MKWVSSAVSLAAFSLLVFLFSLICCNISRTYYRALPSQTETRLRGLSERVNSSPSLSSFNPPPLSLSGASLSYACLANVSLPLSCSPAGCQLDTRSEDRDPVPDPSILIVIIMASLLLPALHVVPSPASPEDDALSSDSSYIGSASSDAESESATKDDATSPLGSLSCLEDFLPIKKGLSNHFVGKSRSFTNLSECENGNAADLAKGENPFNKRRRIQISCQRRASCSSLVPLLLSPEHALHEAEVENDDDDSDEDGDDSGRAGESSPSLAPTPHRGNLFNEKIMIVNNGKVKIKSPRSFPLFHL